MKKKNSTTIGIGCILFALAVLLYAQFGFNGKLVRDDAVWLYGGQQMAQGVAPYVSIFDIKSPLGPMLAGAGAWLAYKTGGDVILYVRLVFFLLSCLSVVALFFWAFTLFRLYYPAILTALVFLCFWGFSRHAGSGPQVKTAMVLFQILALNCSATKNWFWAGVFGSLAAWVWQPAVIFPLITLVLALVQTDRWRALAKTVLGGLTPSFFILAYFIAKQSFSAFWQGAVLFHLQHLYRGTHPFIQHTKTIAHTLMDAFPLWAYAMLPGLLCILCFYFWRYAKNNHSWFHLLQTDPFAGLLLTFPFLVILSICDFQGYDDFFIFLPYVAVGIAVVLFLLIVKISKFRFFQGPYRRLPLFMLYLLLIVQAALFYRGKNREMGSYLLKQKEWARQIEQQYLKTGKLLSIGTPELMVISHQRNAHRFLFIADGIDNQINAETSGGFEGWLQQIAEIDPAAIGFKYAPGRFMDRLQEWLRSRYQETRVGDWTIYVRTTS